MYGEVCDRGANGAGEGLDQSRDSIFSVLVWIRVFPIFMPVPVPAPVSESECVVCVCIVPLCAASMAAVGEMPSVPIMGTAAMRDNFSPSRQRISLLLRSFPLEEPFTRLDRSRRRPDESVSNLFFILHQLLSLAIERQLTWLWPVSSSLSYGERTIFITTDST